MSKKAKKPAAVSSDFMGMHNDPFQFDVDAQLKAKITSEGFVCRWINRSTYIANRGDHRGWRPYQMPKSELQSKGALDFQYGVDADGYIMRGDLILAVRPAEVHQKNKQRIELRKRAQQGHQAKAAQELREKTGMKVLEGYEDEVKGYKTRGEEDFGED